MPDGESAIDFEQLGLAGVLRRYRLQVPANQRDYSWTDREVLTMFEDFSRSISSGERAYFLGSIVTIPRQPGLLEVVDGQQRLATTAILLSAMRDVLEADEAVIADSIQNDFLTQVDRQARERVPKLRLNVDDNAHFGSLLTGLPPGSDRDSHLKLNESARIARSHIDAVLKSKNKKDWGDEINRWIEFLEHNALVILLKVPSDSNAYKMFETLNDRGLRTSQADLVKNYLFGQSGDRLPEVQNHWAMMRGSLESLDEDDITITFLRQALIAMRGYLREGEVYDVVQSIARGASASASLANDLETLANDYVAIFNPQNEKWNRYDLNVRRAIETLNLLNIKPMRPLILAASMALDPKEATRAFNLFISWGVRLLIAGGTRSGSVEQPLAALASDVFAGKVADAGGLSSAMSKVIPADPQFEAAFKTATVNKASLARYYLRSLERTAKNESEPWYIPNDDQTAINLEHVLPKKPENNWPQFDEEAVRVYCRRLGNLALVKAKSNSDMKSAKFEEKKEVFKGSPYSLTSQLCDFDDWGPDEVSARQELMAGLAVKTWPL